MNKIITGFLEDLSFGQVQIFKNMAVVPIFLKEGKSPQYLTLKEAMDMGISQLQSLTLQVLCLNLRPLTGQRCLFLYLTGRR